MNRIFLLLCFITATAPARILEVGAGKTYATLRQAALAAQPGDTIRIAGGVYPGGEYIENLRGTSAAWITIEAEPGASVTFRGGGEAWHLTDPAYLRIERIGFEGQTGNGVNIDDGGSYDTPAHHVVLRGCAWRAMNATGNNDQLKLSGVDSFAVRECTFADGSPGGSMVDMVGCHAGVFEQNRFANAGSNCIQAKGGSSQIRIARNTFADGGQRAINIGGSTGEAFFRPLDAPYEAAEIAVHANVFTGAVAPIAYVGAVRCEVVNNTIIRPEKWALRILQESTAPRFLPCGDNRFVNNIVYLGSAAANPTVNIGPNTDPASFIFANNLWFNEDSPSWGGPNLPSPESDGIVGRDPEFVDVSTPGSPLRGTSPAIGRGLPVTEPAVDYPGNPFSDPRSIGAVEGRVTSAVADAAGIPSFRVTVHPHPVTGRCVLRISTLRRERVTARLVDAAGRTLALLLDAELEAGEHALPIEIPATIGSFGARLLEVRSSASTRVFLVMSPRR